MSESVKVMVRCRPMNKKEVANGSQVCVRVHKAVNQVQLETHNGEPEKSFTFDSVYGVDST